jgi:anti-sigma factor RsiW
VTDLDCNELVELVTAYLEGGLDDAETRQVEEHLAGCTGCTAYVEQIRTTIAGAQALGGDGPARLPDDVRAGLIEAFRNSRR